VILSRAMGAAILCATSSCGELIGAQKLTRLSFPYPFTRAVVLIAPPIVVPAGASTPSRTQSSRSAANADECACAARNGWPKSPK
jgi:lysophospholipid acyltransferase (LPLAT)-like uncharacterized protein